MFPRKLQLASAFLLAAFALSGCAGDVTCDNGRVVLVDGDEYCARFDDDRVDECPDNGREPVEDFEINVCGTGDEAVPFDAVVSRLAAQCEALETESQCDGERGCLFFTERNHAFYQNGTCTDGEAICILRGKRGGDAQFSCHQRPVAEGVEVLSLHNSRPLPMWEQLPEPLESDACLCLKVFRDSLGDD